MEVVGEAANADNARLLLSELQPDLVFLDVQMPGESGFDFLMKLDSFPAVIFTTAFDQFALKAFEFGAYDYLLKPVEPARLAASLVRIGDRESVRLPSSGSVDEVLRESDQVFFRANRSQIINLRWVQSIRPWFSRGLRIKLRSGSEVEISRRRSQQFRDFASL